MKYKKDFKHKPLLKILLAPKIYNPNLPLRLKYLLQIMRLKTTSQMAYQPASNVELAIIITPIQADELTFLHNATHITSRIRKPEFTNHNIYLNT